MHDKTLMRVTQSRLFRNVESSWSRTPTTAEQRPAICLSRSRRHLRGGLLGKLGHNVDSTLPTKSPGCAVTVGAQANVRRADQLRQNDAIMRHRVYQPNAGLHLMEGQRGSGSRPGRADGPAAYRFAPKTLEGLRHRLATHQ